MSEFDNRMRGGANHSSRWNESDTEAHIEDSMKELKAMTQEKSVIHLCGEDKQGKVFDSGFSIRRVVFDLNWINECDGLQHGRVLYRGSEYDVVRPQGSLDDWQLIEA